jgi:metal-responsive CopG/Arc/MetJ family transcriptional regulator
MARTRKVAISLPADLLGEVEKLRRATGESRSGVIQRGILRLLSDRERAARARKYVAGYRRQPESAGEIRAAEAAAADLLALEPWD